MANEDTIQFHPKPELELFEGGMYNAEIDSSSYNVIHPETSTDKNAPLEFNIACTSTHYLDIANCYLYLKVRVTRNYENIKPRVSISSAEGSSRQIYNVNATVFPINLPFSSMFRSLEVFYNENLICQTDQLYPYRAYLETMLSYNRSSKDHNLRLSHFYLDNEDHDSFTGIHEDPNTLPPSTNLGGRRRYDISKYSKTFEGFAQIHSEIFCQNKMLPPVTGTLRLRFNRSDPQFCLMSNNDPEREYVIVIEKATLWYRKVVVEPNLQAAHLSLLTERKREMKYPVKRVLMKYFTKPMGISNISLPNLSTGVLPRKVFLCFVEGDAFMGHYTKSPFKFLNLNISSIRLQVGNEEKPFQTLDMDFENDLYMQGYFSFLHATKTLFSNDDVGILPEQWANGHTIFGFDLTDDESEEMRLKKSDKLSCEIKLDRSTDFTVVVLCYMEYDNTFVINAENQMKIMD